MGKAEDDDLTAAVASMRPDLVSQALARGADPNAKIGDVPAVQIAALSGPVTNVDLLIKAGADVNARGNCADTALHLACAGGGPDRELIARRLVEAGADINAAGIDGRLPLDFAAQKRNKAVAKVLVEAGAKCAADNLNWVATLSKAKGQQAR